MEDQILPSRDALTEALELSFNILKDIELSNISLEGIALKIGRLARLLNDFEMQKIIEYEVGGYPGGAKGLPSDIYRLAVIANREYEKKENDVKFVYKVSINSLENDIKIRENALKAGADAPRNNQIFRAEISKACSRLASRRSFLYHYVLRKHYELKFSGIADDIFSRLRSRIDSNIGNLLPDAVRKFNAIYDNLQSDNPENWSNAVHGCRRILQDMADVVFPAIEQISKKGDKEIRLGKDNYINRIIAFVENSSSSKRFEDLVGSHLQFLGDRLDSIFKAAQKGSHDNILTQEEADRYITYTYLIVGDILSLWSERESLENRKIMVEKTA